MKTILTLIMLALCASAQARIGETVDECVKRYGKPEKYDEAAKAFICNKDGVLILLWFTEGKCCKIVLVKQRDKNNLPEFFSEVELETLLAANGEGWQKIKTGLTTSWQNADGSRLAQYSSLDGSLVLMTRAQVELDAAAVDAAEKAKLKNF